MGRNYGLPTAPMGTYMGPTNLRVTVGQAEETDCWWKRYKHPFVFSSYVLLMHTKVREAIPYFHFHYSRVFSINNSDVRAISVG